MSTKVIRATSSNVSPAEDAKLYRNMFPDDGLFEDIEITSLGSNSVNIPAMYGIMEGRDFTTDEMTFSVTLPSSDTDTGYILVTFDTTTDDVISITSQIGSYTPTYEDINGSGTVCEMIIASYEASTTAVTSITMCYNLVSIGSNMEATLATGDTSVSFTNSMFSDTTYFDIYTPSIDVQPTGWSLTDTTFTIEFDAQDADYTIGIVWKNYS